MKVTIVVLYKSTTYFSEQIDPLWNIVAHKTIEMDSPPQIGSNLVGIPGGSFVISEQDMTISIQKTKPTFTLSYTIDLGIQIHQWHTIRQTLVNEGWTIWRRSGGCGDNLPGAL